MKNATMLSDGNRRVLDLFEVDYGIYCRGGWSSSVGHCSITGVVVFFLN